MSENINHIKTDITVKSKERPQICRRQFNFVNKTKNVKMRGKGQNMSENIDLVHRNRDRQA